MDEERDGVTQRESAVMYHYKPNTNDRKVEWL